MTINVKHAFISAKSDDIDTTIVRPSNWNENHTLTMATNKLLGRGTAAAGPVEEITLGTSLSLSGTTLNVSAATVSAASRLLGRGSASGAGASEEITLGTNLSMSGTTLNASLGGGVAAVSSPQGRLTLQTGTPVMTTTQSAKTAIFYTPYVGNQVPIWDGTTMTPTTFTELTVATTDATKSPAAIGASKVNDWFVWSDAGTLRIGHGPDWTDDTTRSAGTALVRVGGLLLNNASITNGPAASRGTYVGTTRSNASSQLDWIYGATATNGTAGFLGVWNAYNRVDVASASADATTTWTYGTATVRPANNSSSMRCSFVIGLSEDSIEAIYNGISRAGAGTDAFLGVGFDSTTAFSGSTGVSQDVNYSASASGAFVTTPAIGFHYIQALEFSSGGTASIFYGIASNYRTSLSCKLGM